MMMMMTTISTGVEERQTGVGKGHPTRVVEDEAGVGGGGGGGADDDDDDIDDDGTQGRGGSSEDESVTLECISHELNPITLLAQSKVLVLLPISDTYKIRR